MNYAEEELPLQNSQAKRDLVHMVHLRDSAMLYTLYQRHTGCQPYSSARNFGWQNFDFGLSRICL
jgi:hypothetical protein